MSSANSKAPKSKSAMNKLANMMLRSMAAPHRQKMIEGRACKPTAEQLHHHAVPTGFEFLAEHGGRLFYFSSLLCCFWSAGVLYSALDDAGTRLLSFAKAFRNHGLVILSTINETRSGDKRKWAGILVCYLKEEDDLGDNEEAGYVVRFSKTGLSCAACGALHAKNACAKCAPDTPAHAAYCNPKCQREHWPVHRESHSATQ